MSSNNRTFYFKKLVRDNTVPGFKADPTVTDMEWHELSKVDYRQELVRKIHEEADEVPIDNHDMDEAASEIGDLLDVIEALALDMGISDEQVQAARDKKNKKRGGFSSRHYVTSITVTPGSEWEKYCLDDPEKYPEKLQKVNG